MPSSSWRGMRMDSAARRQLLDLWALGPVSRTSASWASGSAPISHSITRVAISRFSFAIRFV